MILWILLVKWKNKVEVDNLKKENYKMKKVLKILGRIKEFIEKVCSFIKGCLDLKNFFGNAETT